jgi:hypothetical protein
MSTDLRAGDRVAYCPWLPGTKHATMTSVRFVGTVRRFIDDDQADVDWDPARDGGGGGDRCTSVRLYTLVPVETWLNEVWEAL